MNNKIGIFVVLMLVITTIPITGSTESVDKNVISYTLGPQKTKWYYFCYIEIEGMTYAGNRNLFLPHINDNDDTFCLRWLNRFNGNATISVYRKDGGILLHEQIDLREFHMIGFFGSYNYRPDPLILKGKVFAIQLFNYWTPPH